MFRTTVWLASTQSPDCTPLRQCVYIHIIYIYIYIYISSSMVFSSQSTKFFLWVYLKLQTPFFDELRISFDCGKFMGHHESWGPGPWTTKPPLVSNGGSTENTKGSLAALCLSRDTLLRLRFLGFQPDVSYLKKLPILFLVTPPEINMASPKKLRNFERSICRSTFY